MLTFLEIIESLGVDIHFENNTLKMNTEKMSLANLNRALIKKIRVGIFLFPALLKRFGELEIPYPGGAERSEERRVGKECRSRWSPYH